MNNSVRGFKSFLSDSPLLTVKSFEVSRHLSFDSLMFDAAMMSTSCWPRALSTKNASVNPQPHVAQGVGAIAGRNLFCASPSVKRRCDAGVAMKSMQEAGSCIESK
jgi:hypothetical protein